jgi:hypothetical protein
MKFRQMSFSHCLVGADLEFGHECGDAEGPVERTDHMNVISDSTDGNRRTLKVIRGSSEIRVDIFSDGWFGEKGFPVLGEKMRCRRMRESD